MDNTSIIYKLLVYIHKSNFNIRHVYAYIRA